MSAETRWRDVTSYSQSAPRIPSSFELRAGHTRIVVTRMHGCGDAWFLRCHDVGIECREMKSKDLGTCQADAVRMVRDVLTKALAALDAAQLDIAAAKERK